MAKVDILLKKWDTGDWEQLVVDGNVYYEGHSIPNFIWTQLIEDLGFPVAREEVIYDEENDG